MQQNGADCKANGSLKTDKGRLAGEVRKETINAFGTALIAVPHLVMTASDSFCTGMNT